MGCKNCNGTVSQNIQLPPGCDSIQAITTDVTAKGDTIVTITFCSGAIQQFTIPAGQSGENGTDGTNGADGTNGISIEDITSSVEDGLVTLTFTLSDGSTIVETFTIETQEAQAYVIDHVGLDVPNEDNIDPTLIPNGPNSVIAKSLIPAGSFPSSEDTIYFDILINLQYAGALATGKGRVADIFNSLQLELNSDPNPSSGGINLLLESNDAKVKFPTTTIAVTGEITRRFVEDRKGDLATALDLVANMSVYTNRTQPNNTGTLTAVAGNVQNLVWSVKNQTVDINADNYLKIVAAPGNYVIDSSSGPVSYSVSPTQIYFTTRYLQRR